MALQPNSDEYYMKEALKEAKKALELDEVPVGSGLSFAIIKL